MLDHAGSNTPDLVTRDSIPFCATQCRYLGLDVISLGERDGRSWLAKKSAGLNALVVAPLALGQTR